MEKLNLKKLKIYFRRDLISPPGGGGGGVEMDEIKCSTRFSIFTVTQCWG